jgi:hypothetical protein
MRFTVTLRATAGGWSASIASPELKDWMADSRKLLKGAKGYPHPAKEESDHWDDDELCIDVEDKIAPSLHRRIVVGEPDPRNKEVERFGGYLRAVLLGPWWSKIKEDAPGHSIELEIDIPADEALQDFPWEMMAADDVPMAADPNRRIAITRIIATKDALSLSKIEIPLRVLFIVGRQIDEALQPGAEYLGLLRHFRMPIPSSKGTSVGAALHTRLLLQARREILADAIDEFCPSVVHIVAHGRLGDGGPEILLTREEGWCFEDRPDRRWRVGATASRKDGTRAPGAGGTRQCLPYR